MIPDPDSVSPPGEGTPGQLLGWRPKLGVISVYIRIDPGDRSEQWRTAIRNGLAAASDHGGQIADRETRRALEATSQRLQRELLDELPHGEPPGMIGFVEVARKGGEERWYGAQVPPRRTAVLRGPLPQIHPLLQMLDDGAPLGVAVLASDRVRLLDWRLGRGEQLHDWELEYFGGDWRERKAPRPRDPARGAVSASGRDQYNQRMEDTQERFAEQTGALARTESKGRDWGQLLIFGDERYVGRFARGYGGEVRYAGAADLISEASAQIERRVEEMLPEVNRARERSLIERIEEAAYAEGRSALGVQETLQALQEGRVAHLVYDAECEYSNVGLKSNGEASSDGLPLIERMIGLALSTGAAVTPVEGKSTEALEERGGVVALLRY